MTWLSPPLVAELATLRRPLRSVGVLLSGNLVKLALGLLASALTYRALGPANAGRFVIVMSLVSVFSFLAEFGFRDAAVTYVARAGSTTEAQAVARSFLIAKLLFGSLAAVTLASLAGWIVNNWYHGALQPGLLRLAALALLTGGLLNYVQSLLEARQAFGRLSLISMVQALLRAGLIVSLFATGRLALWPLVALEVVVPLVLLALGQRFLPMDLRLRLPRGFGTHFSKLWRFSRWLAVAAAASTIFLSLDVVLLGHFRPAAQVGIYGAALALLAKFEVGQNVILTWAFPDACRCRGKADLKSYLARSFRLTGLAAAGSLLILPIAGPLLNLFYGSAYADATLPFAILLLGFAVGLVAQPAAFVLYPLERVRYIAAGDTLQLLFFIGVGLWLIPAYGVLGAALAVFARQLLGASLTAIFVRQALR